jgi:invasion protein IalB
MRKSSVRTPAWLALCAAAAAAFHVSSARAQAPAAPAPAAAASLPGGSTSLQETFGDWRVVCVVEGTAKRCVMTQEQVNQQSRQRVLAVELSGAADKLDGVLVLPFGLALERGVALQVNDQPAQSPLKFRTCLPGGCLVPLNFDAKTAAAFRAATTLKAKAVADNGQDQPFTISLKGFGQALDRVAVLSR